VTRARDRCAGAVVALVLAGGHGRRLWPLSTARRPKPFRELFEAEAPVRRVLRQAEAWLGAASDVWLAIGAPQLAAARAAVPDLGRYTVVTEEHPAETTVVIARAALALTPVGADTVLVVLAADQRLGPDDALLEALDGAVAVARGGPTLVSVGVRPDHPSTAYGYMQLGEPLDIARNAFEGEGYIEKPDRETAARLLATGRSVWNAGIFAFRASTLLAALRRHAPDVLEALAGGGAPARPVRAIDYELMERVAAGDPERRAYVVAGCTFEDLGTLAALSSTVRPDARGNRARGDVDAQGCHDCALLAEPPVRLQVTGLRDAVVAASADGQVLVSALASDARPVVELLTRGDGCFAEVRTQGLEASVDVDGVGHEVHVSAAGTMRGRPAKAIELRRCDNEEEAAGASADRAVEILRSAIERRGRAVWIPSTGRTVVRCYELLASRHRGDLDWARVEVFQMDEIADLPVARTARHFLMHRLIEPLGIRRHALMPDATSATAERLELALCAARPDLVLHGMGENGHLGLNEPGSPFDAPSRAVTLSEETRVAKGPSAARGCTLGLGALLAVPRTILVVTGAHKRDALAAALFGPATPEVPASALQLRSVTTVIADRAALPDRADPDARM
jgi:mannose-1-phosphate guanylyltransferase/6-phosphogluconolactonase/glucosamine-6-phosphate isomerase/deaminase